MLMRITKEATIRYTALWDWVSLDMLIYALLYLYDMIASYDNRCPYSLDTSILKFRSLGSNSALIILTVFPEKDARKA